MRRIYEQIKQIKQLVDESERGISLSEIVHAATINAYRTRDILEVLIEEGLIQYRLKRYYPVKKLALDGMS